MSTTVRTRARRGEGGELRIELLDAAERLLVREGSMDEVSVRMIADAVGVTPPAIYNHFADKDELFFEVCRRRFGEFHEQMSAAVDGVDDAAERVAALGRAYVAFGLERPEQYRVLFVDDVMVELDAKESEDLPGVAALQLLVDAVADGVAAGRFRSVDPYLTAVAMWAQVHGLVLIILSMGGEHHPIPAPDIEPLVDHTLDQCLHGLLA